MSKFVVWSSTTEKVGEELVTHEVIEVTRTDRKIAEEDAALIHDLFRRKSWVQESKT